MPRLPKKFGGAGGIAVVVLLVFAGTRTMDLMSMAIRLAGFEIELDQHGPLVAYCPMIVGQTVGEVNS